MKVLALGKAEDACNIVSHVLADADALVRETRRALSGFRQLVFPDRVDVSEKEYAELQEAAIRTRLLAQAAARLLDDVGRQANQLAYEAYTLPVRKTRVRKPKRGRRGS